jgi:hypothetical protein
MTYIICVLSTQEIAECNQLGDDVGRRRAALDTVRSQITAAALAGVAQNSPRWDQLCKDLADKVDAHNTAVVAERDWWRSKGFKV